MSKVKIERIASQIARELSLILLGEARDKVLKDITITDVNVSADLGVAKVYYTFLGDYEREYVAEELKKASGFLRSELAQRIQVRHTPELRFQFDESIEYGTNIERILAEINSKQDKESE